MCLVMTGDGEQKSHVTEPFESFKAAGLYFPVWSPQWNSQLLIIACQLIYFVCIDLS